MDEGARDGDHARVCLPLVIITDHTARTDICHTHAGSAGTPSSRIASANVTMPWPSTTTMALPLVRVSSYSSRYPPAPRHIMSAITRRLCANPGHRCPQATRYRIHIATVWEVLQRWWRQQPVRLSLNVVGMISTEAGMSVKKCSERHYVSRSRDVTVAFFQNRLACFRPGFESASNCKSK